MESNKQPLVCICIPAYNAEATIGKTLESLISQTYDNIKILVIDNNCNDSTVDVVNSYVSKYKNIDLISYEETVPSHENFDRCIKHSYGEYTCIFHSDDMYKEDIIEKEVSFLENHKDVGAVFSFANIVNEKDEIISSFNIAKELLDRDVYSYDELFPVILKYGGCFVTPSAMVRTSIYKNDIIKHQINDSFGPAFDLDVWIRILKRHKVGFIKEALMYYRMSINSLSFRSLLMYRNTIEECMLNVLEHHLSDFKDSGNEYNLFRDLICKVKLDNVFKAYVSGDLEYAKILLSSIDKSKVSFKYKKKIFRYEIMTTLKLPLFIRKKMVLKKFRGVLKNNESSIEFLK